MRGNLIVILWTLIGIAVAWFLMMSISRNIFLHSDIDISVYGTVPMNITDIGNQCGDDYVNSNERIEFKLNTAGKIVYLCPQGLSPIQKKVTAVILTDDFRNTLRPNEQAKVFISYPLQAAAPPVNPYVSTQPS